jgi:tRNA acetyltransferase TAN1
VLIRSKYAEKFYGVDGTAANSKGIASDDEDVDATIEKELNSLRKPEAKPLFTSIKLDTQCLVFFKVSPPIEPVAFVHHICEDAASSTSKKQSRSVKRLTPMTLTGKATEASIDEVARQVLAPHFHTVPVSAKKVRVSPSGHVHLYVQLMLTAIVRHSREHSE